MCRLSKSLTLLVLALLCTPTFGADFFNLFGFKKGHKGSVSLAALSNYEMTQGVKEALSRGMSHGLASLARTNGFLEQADVRIAVPDKLKKLEKSLLAQKQDALVDEFVLSLNRAAEQTLLLASPALQEAAEQLTVDEPRELLMGPDDALSQHLRQTKKTELEELLLPVVQKAAEQAGVGACYAKLVKKADLSSSWFNLGRRQLDLNEYVATSTVDGLLKRISDYERQLRQNPSDSPSELLKKVFGAL